MFSLLRTWLDERRHGKELIYLRWVLHGMNQHIEPLTLIKIGSRIRRALEHDHRELDLIEEDAAADRMKLDDLVERSAGFNRLGDKLGRTEEDIAPVLAMRLLTGWLHCKVIARNSRKVSIIEEPHGLEDLFFGHMKNCLHAVRGEPFEPL